MRSLRTCLWTLTLQTKTVSKLQKSNKYAHMSLLPRSCCINAAQIKNRTLLIQCTGFIFCLSADGKYSHAELDYATNNSRINIGNVATYIDQTSNSFSADLPRSPLILKQGRVDLWITSAMPCSTMMLSSVL